MERAGEAGGAWLGAQVRGGDIAGGDRLPEEFEAPEAVRFVDNAPLPDEPVAALGGIVAIDPHVSVRAGAEIDRWNVAVDHSVDPSRERPKSARGVTLLQSHLATYGNTACCE
jgi:hypothetical protein